MWARHSRNSFCQFLPLYVVFINLTKGFDSVIRSGLVQHTRTAGLPINAIFHSCSGLREPEGNNPVQRLQVHNFHGLQRSQTGLPKLFKKTFFGTSHAIFDVQ